MQTELSQPDYYLNPDKTTMKNTINPNPLKRKRDRDFMNVCRRIIRNNDGPLRAADVAVAAAREPAPEFYVSFGQARKKLGDLRRRGPAAIGKRNAAMYLDINSRVEELQRKMGCSLSDGIAIVLAEGKAPRFYLTEKSAVFLYSILRSRSRKERQATHRHRPLPGQGK